MKKLSIVFVLLLLGGSQIMAQAELRIINKSERTITAKVMQNNSPAADSLFSTLTIKPQSRTTEYFSNSGHFYLKTKAVRDGAEPVYRKGNPFEVYVGSDGYSVLTVTIDIKETNTPSPLDGKRISKEEFDLD